MAKRSFATQRLVVRSLRRGDLAACARTGRESLITPEIGAGKLLTLSQLHAQSFEEMISRREELAASDQFYVLSAFLREDGRFVGDTMLFDVTRDPYARAELGTVVSSPFRRMGLGTELIAGTLEWGGSELGLSEIKGFVEADNSVSMVACLNAGFSLCASTPIPRMFQGEQRWGWPIVWRKVAS